MDRRLPERTLLAGPVWIFMDGIDDGYNREICAGAENELNKAGFTVKLYKKTMEDTFHKAIEGLGLSRR